MTGRQRLCAVADLGPGQARCFNAAGLRAIVRQAVAAKLETTQPETTPVGTGTG